MKWFYNIKLSKKMLIGFIFVELISGIVAYFLMPIIRSVTGNSIDINLQLIIFIILNLILAIVIGIFFSKLVVKPINYLLNCLQRLTAGDMTIDVDINTKDEIGLLAGLNNKNTFNINRIMSNVSTTSEQVAASSRQVSETSMELAQGAAAQSSSVEELTASLEQISAQTRNNADNANLANGLAESVKTNAAKGNIQMNDMLKAMDEINDSSNNISKIIKVIDEIAFQTNILALNAAVEAARAGQHGKGFAVVAEEVRNLASRSANAAKETTDMIEGSINKVVYGTKIANHTADALNEIVDGVGKVASLVGDIAVASNEQAIGIDQISKGIEQVSHVIQTNSATAQECSAAGSELSKQSAKLKRLMEGFTLKTLTKEEYKKKLQEFYPEAAEKEKTKALV